MPSLTCGVIPPRVAIGLGNVAVGLANAKALWKYLDASFPHRKIQSSPPARITSGGPTWLLAPKFESL
jgi:hypothetical protein